MNSLLLLPAVAHSPGPGPWVRTCLGWQARKAPLFHTHLWAKNDVSSHHWMLPRHSSRRCGKPCYSQTQAGTKITWQRIVSKERMHIVLGPCLAPVVCWFGAPRNTVTRPEFSRKIQDVDCKSSWLHKVLSCLKNIQTLPEQKKQSEDEWGPWASPGSLCSGEWTSNKADRWGKESQDGKGTQGNKMIL